MDHRLIEGLMEAIAPLIKSYVDERIAKEVAPLHLQIKEYEARAPLKGEPGKDADPEMVAAVVAAELARALPDAVAAIPVPQNGKDADPEVIRAMIADQVAILPPAAAGKDVDMVEVEQMVGSAVERAMAALPPPAAGKDADPAVIAEMVDAAVAKIPPAAPGKDVDPADVERMVEVAVERVISALPPAPAGKDADPAVVAAMVAEQVAALPPPTPGKDADPEVVAALVAQEVSKALEAWPRPADGKSVTIEEVRPVLEEMVAALPPAPAGKDADPAEVAALIVEDVAKLIPPPQDGKSVTVEDVLPLIQETVEKAVAALPVPKDGADGKDGVGLTGALIGRNGELVVTLSDGSTKDLGVVVGKDADQAEILRFIEERVAGLPKPKDGKDGFSLKDFNTELLEDGRTVLLKFGAGDILETHELVFPVVLDRGVFKDGAAYQRGDGVTFGGSFWIAQKDAPEGKPQDGSKDWRLAVKRGRNGADGVVRHLPPQGPVKA